MGNFVFVTTSDNIVSSIDFQIEFDLWDHPQVVVINYDPDNYFDLYNQINGVWDENCEGVSSCLIAPVINAGDTICVDSRLPLSVLMHFKTMPESWNFKLMGLDAEANLMWDM